MEKKKYSRVCSNCNTEIFYSSVQSFCNAKRKNTICKSCKAIERANRPKQKERLKSISSRKGEENGMYGKSFFDVWLEKYGKEEADKKLKDWKEKIKRKGEENGMYGKSFYDVWLEKYGKEEADKKYEAWLIKQDETAARGEKNHRFGKPSPRGSGNGWSGWYKGWFFRSLRELSFMVNVIERFDFKWENGENKEWRIEYYDWDGKRRNYFPDFILNDKIVVDCKPKKLWNSTTVKLKKEAAEKEFEKRGLKYKLFSPEILSEDRIKKMRNDGAIKFTNRYEQKFKEKYG